MTSPLSNDPCSTSTVGRGRSDFAAETRYSRAIPPTSSFSRVIPAADDTPQGMLVKPATTKSRTVAPRGRDPCMKARSSHRARSNEREIGAAFSVLAQQQVGAIIVGSADPGGARYRGDQRNSTFLIS